mgnify:CR=1 FL=1
MSPKAFDDCVKRGGRVRAKDLGNNRYIPICYIDGKGYPGHAKERKAEEPKKEERERDG